MKARKAVVAGIRCYQILVSPLKLPCCRFIPNCSTYMAEAVHMHGIRKGLYLGLLRIGRCHPWGGCGFDPVPPART